jgi:hypothetical protein
MRSSGSASFRDRRNRRHAAVSGSLERENRHARSGHCRSSAPPAAVRRARPASRGARWFAYTRRRALGSAHKRACRWSAAGRSPWTSSDRASRARRPQWQTKRSGAGRQVGFLLVPSDRLVGVERDACMPIGAGAPVTSGNCPSRTHRGGDSSFRCSVAWKAQRRSGRRDERPAIPRARSPRPVWSAAPAVSGAPGPAVPAALRRRGSRRAGRAVRTDGGCLSARG